ncbi:hypothetical protein BGX38DRAFT_1234965, partial [Terfezia claveryi]
RPSKFSSYRVLQQSNIDNVIPAISTLPWLQCRCFLWLRYLHFHTTSQRRSAFSLCPSG